ncbi:flavodoxin domain-containing protein [Clostridium sp. 19966]|uniref:flavodoxin domain-containing protein n=1 Tax=Clostridium sp. 19966 TaxID=2768166 RepID=UPI0028DFF9D2|nr:flavodoxin domain-containing protein [Clostridium sp. 19966]MDT8715180.1 flavodoxin domain-containing protein [Clostridium sp. 19966]
MDKITVIYWSASGNTEAMAKLISEGAEAKGAKVDLLNVSDATLDKIKETDVLVLGSPAMGDEVIEESEMEPFVESISTLVNGKKVALFGSYGWGDGLMVQNAPEVETEDECREFGEKLVENF